MQNEIVLPDAKPAYEWIRGAAVQKVSPKRIHGRLQGRVFTALDAWAGSHGEVAVEWRFRITPPQEPTSVLVPDVAYVSNERLRGLSGEEREEPRVAPNVAIEVRSPDDRQSRLDEKTRVYIAGGADAVLVIDPASRSAIVSDARGTTHFEENMVVTHPSMPGFSLDLAALFTVIDY